MGREQKPEAAEVTTWQGTVPKECSNCAYAWEISKLLHAVNSAVAGILQKTS